MQTCSPKELSKPILRSGSQKLRPKNGPAGFPTAVPGRFFPKVFCRAAPESCASKLPPEVAVQSYCRKAATFQTCKPKIAPIVADDVCFLMFFAQQAPKILSLTVFLKVFRQLAKQSCQTGPKNCSPDLGHNTKLLPNVLSTDVAKKAAEPSKGSLQSFFPAALQRCVYIGSAQKRNTQPAPLHKKLLACARLLPQSCDSAPNTAPSQPFYFQNHFPKAASETCYQLLFKDVNCSKFNLSNIKTKTAPHSYAGQRLPKSCAPGLLRLPPGKLFPKAAPNVVFYSRSPKLLFFTENVLQCCRSPKRVCKATAAKRLYFKPLPPKLLSAVASENCFPNLP